MGSNTNTIKTCLEWQATKALIWYRDKYRKQRTSHSSTKDIGLLRVNINKHLVFSKHTYIFSIKQPRRLFKHWPL